MATAKPYDAARYLDSEEIIEAYLADAFEEGDAGGIVAALGNMAKARGMTALAMQMGLSRESLYRSLSGEGNPAFATIVKILDALDMELSVRAKRRIVDAA